MERRRLQLANSHDGGEKVWTVTPDTDCKDLYIYLVDKYGLNYGRKTKPLPINEEIYLQGFQYVGDGQVKYLYLGKGLENFRQLGFLYLYDYEETLYAVKLVNNKPEEIDKISPIAEMWD